MTDARGLSVEIRQVGPDTAYILARIVDDVFDEPVTSATLDGFAVAAGHALFVAVADVGVVGQIRGMVHVQPDRRSDLYIDNLGVAPKWQRRGIATRLVRALLAWGTDRQCETVWVATETDNGVAQAFYAAMGLSQRQECVVLSHDLATITRGRA